MEKQRSRFPELEVPRIFIYLRDLFYQLNGVKTEGVFRISAVSSEVMRFKEEIDKGNYDLFLLAKGNAHVATATLKLWFRELQDPLIPNSF
jgi:hypothetical protein